MNRLDNAVESLAAYTVFFAGATVVAAAAPFVGMVTAPIFAMKAIPSFYDYKNVNDKEWSHHQLSCRNGEWHSEIRYGRTVDQDFTRWDGKAIAHDDQSLRKKIEHESLDLFAHGAKDSSFISKKGSKDSAFKTIADGQWLDHEIERREKKDVLDRDLRVLRLSLKLLLPVVGVFWAFMTEIPSDKEDGCKVCLDNKPEDTHWNGEMALKYHRRVLTDNFRLQMTH